jgi:hypothetical protein
MLKKIVSYEGTDYTLTTITAKVGRGYVFSNTDGTKMSSAETNTRLVLASLESGGNPVTEDFIDNLPYFVDGKYAEFIEAALVVNGFKKESVGKAEAEASPAE